MTDERKDIPPVNSPNFLEKVRETLSMYLGNRGSGLDRGVTVRDLTDAGLVQLRSGFGAVGGTRSPIGGVGPLIIEAAAYESDLTPPPSPSGFTASAAISNLLLQCDPPLYSAGHGHAKSKLYGASWVSGPLPVFADAVVITEFGGTVASHATNPATTWHLWLTWVTVDGVESTTAAGGTNGVVTRTGEDVALLLEALTGGITQSQLYADLGARIDLIDTPTTGLVDQVVAVNSVVNNPTTGMATKASVSQAATAKAEAIAASASVTDTISARLNTGDFAAVQVQSSANASSVTGLLAQYTVKLDVGGKVSGYGLASTTASSEFAIRADRFYIAPPATGGGDATQIIPFVVQATATTINGVAVPAGVYMDTAFIKNGTMTTAKIADLAVDNGKIASLSAAKITAGAIGVGSYIQSTNFTAGSAGWKINADGTAELANAVVRGAIYASSGTFTGTVSASTINSSTVNSATINGGVINLGDFTSYNWPAAGGTGAHLSSQGLLLGNANASAGNPAGRYFQIETPAGGLPKILTNIPTYIEDAQVTTLKIGAHQVTVPVSSAGGKFVGNGAYQSINVASITTTATGFINVICVANCEFYQTTNTWYMRVEIDGYPGTSYGGTYIGQSSISVVSSRTVAAGVHDVRVLWYGSSANVVIAASEMIVTGSYR